VRRRRVISTFAAAPLFACGLGESVFASNASVSASERLLGTWRSNAERTLAYWQFKEGITPVARERMASWFGKLIIKFTRTSVATEFEGAHFNSRYRVLAETATSVTVEYANDSKREVETIYLGEGFIFKRVGSGANFEYFSRVAA